MNREYIKIEWFISHHPRSINTISNFWKWFGPTLLPLHIYLLLDTLTSWYRTTLFPLHIYLLLDILTYFLIQTNSISSPYISTPYLLTSWYRTTLFPLYIYLLLDILTYFLIQNNSISSQYISTLVQ